VKNSTVFKSVVLIIVFVTLTVIWVYSEAQDTYSEPQYAIQAIDKDLLLIPAYKINDESLYFFIKDKKNLGSVKVRKGLFGWKSGMFTWSQMDSKRKYEKLNGVQGYGENLLYGLIRNGDERVVTVDGHEAEILNLAMIPPSLLEEYNLEGLYLWYFESDDNLNHEQLMLLHRETHEIIQSIKL
jgi:hypothetical protein